MRQLLPQSADAIDVYDVARPPQRRWLRVNFVTSLDGRVADREGRSGGLGGDGDRAMFRALRAHADAILVGAGTARAEGYGPHRVAADLAARRSADGRDAPAAVVVVTASLDLDFETPLFSESVTPAIVLTRQNAPVERQRRAAGSTELIVAGKEDVDLAEGLRQLRDRGYESILCEGGPGLFATLLREALVDELCLTVAPALVGAEGPRLVADLPRDVTAELTWAAQHRSELLLRYALRRT